MALEQIHSIPLTKCITFIDLSAAKFLNQDVAIIHQILYVTTTSLAALSVIAIELKQPTEFIDTFLQTLTKFKYSISHFFATLAEVCWRWEPLSSFIKNRLNFRDTDIFQIRRYDMTKRKMAVFSSTLPRVCSCCPF